MPVVRTDGRAVDVRSRDYQIFSDGYFTIFSYPWCFALQISAIIPSTDVIQLTLTLKMTTPQAGETSITVNNNSPIQDYVHPDDQTQPIFEMTPGKMTLK